MFLEQILAILDQVYQNSRLVDLVDIGLVSLILYSLLLWFRETASRRALIGLFALVAIYFTARAFDMYLTSLIFHTGFAVLLIVLIVVFQDDLRRILEGVANWGLINRRRFNASDRSNLDALVEAIFHLAAVREGALIVLRGRESIERHVDGGIALHGRLSQPLLYSLFDSNSPGHDGAAVLQGDRVERFGVHLPISKNHSEIAGRGTRHSAALGLSECCDALTIVVSEERGVVSVAESGKLFETPSAAALKERIAAFWTRLHPAPQPTSVWSRLLLRDWPLKVTALALAIMLWFAFAYAPDTVQRTFIVPIQYKNLPPTLDLNDVAAHEARLTLSGSERNFRFLEPATLTVSVDLSDATPGSFEVGITDSNIRLPLNLSLYRVEPRILRLTLQPASAQPIPFVPIEPD